MERFRSSDYTGGHAWDALDLAEIDGATVRLHWTDEPYIWHVNDGPEVFAVLDGRVNMHVRSGGVESILELSAGDVCAMTHGDEHLAVPVGAARILVVERRGSI